MKCPVCSNDRMIYKLALRNPDDECLWSRAFITNRYASACGADPRHDVDLLYYDVEAAE